MVQASFPCSGRCHLPRSSGFGGWPRGQVLRAPGGTRFLRTRGAGPRGMGRGLGGGPSGHGAALGSLRVVGRVFGARGEHGGGRVLAARGGTWVLGTRGTGPRGRVLWARMRLGPPELWGRALGGRGVGGSWPLLGSGAGPRGSRGGDWGRVLGAARAGVPPLLPRAAPGVPRRAASPAPAAALRAAGRPSARGPGPGPGWGAPPPASSAAPGARSRGENEAEWGRNHEPELPQVSDPALLRLQRRGSQEQGKPGPPANEWAPPGGLDAAGGTGAGDKFGVRGSSRLSRRCTDTKPGRPAGAAGARR